ncbi:MAG: hypothetical protein V1742_10685 [Pseudomonadota bacterium]
MFKRRLALGCPAVLLLVLLCVPAALAAEKKFKIKDGGKNEIAEVKLQDGGKWKLEMGGQTYSLEGGDNYKFKLPDGTAIKGKRKGDKLKMDRDGQLWLQIKFDSDKIKVSPSGNETDTWSLKIKGDKIKVVKGQTELGDMKYKDGQVKAKDTAGKTLASLKGLKKVTAALSSFVIGEALPVEKRAFLILYFFAAGS